MQTSSALTSLTNNTSTDDQTGNKCRQEINWQMSLAPCKKHTNATAWVSRKKQNKTKHQDPCTCSFCCLLWGLKTYLSRDLSIHRYTDTFYLQRMPLLYFSIFLRYRCNLVFLLRSLEVTFSRILFAEETYWHEWGRYATTMKQLHFTTAF